MQSSKEYQEDIRKPSSVINASQVRAQSNTVGRLRFFCGRDAREYPGGLLRLDPAFAYAEPHSS